MPRRRIRGRKGVVVDVKLNSKAMKRLGRSDDTRRIMQDRVARVESAAKANAPSDTGAYRNGIVGSVRQGNQGDWIGSVDATAPNSRWVEFGTLRTRAYAPLRNAMASVFGTPKGGST